MTQQEFIDGYCERSGVTWEWLSTRRAAVPCDCGDPSCNGWQMQPLEPQDTKAVENYALMYVEPVWALRLIKIIREGKQ